MGKLSKYDDQYWINRYRLMQFVGRSYDLSEFEKKVIVNLSDLNIRNSLLYLRKFVAQKLNN